MRSLRLAVAVLLTAISFALLASCQPRPDAGSTPALTHADSLKLQQDSVATSEAAMRGGRAFLSHCAMCHGNGGNGDGDAAAVIKKEGVTVARLNDAELMDRLNRQQIDALASWERGARLRMINGRPLGDGRIWRVDTWESATTP